MATLQQSPIIGSRTSNDEKATSVEHVDPPPAYRPREGSESSSSSDDDRLESYDSQRPHPDTIVEGSAGGQLEVSLDSDKTKLWTRRGSISVRLEKTEKKGRYMLTADDPEIREIITRGLERQRLAMSSIKKPHTGFRDLVFTRRFTAFDRQNPTNAESPFLGFYVLFWLAMAFLLLRVAVQNYRQHGSVLGNNELLRMMFGREMIPLAVTDGVMCGSTVFGLALQIIVYKGYLDWNRSGWIIQNLWQAFYLGAIVGWTFYREWPWTHTIFTVLHGLVFLMKQHSYAFYNGYLSTLYKRRTSLQRRSKYLETLLANTSPDSSPTGERRRAPNTTEAPEDLRLRRNATLGASRTGTNLTNESNELSNVASALSSGQELNSEQLRAFSNLITEELAALDKELKGKCTITDNHYPRNLTLFNWAEWTCLPTLVYELEYPRQESINWSYVTEKTGAVFGVLTIMQVISQAYIYPAVKEAVRMKEAGMTLEERWQEFPYLLLDMMFPLLLEQLLTWYLIWECVLNVLAEVTYFADRGFYGNWWSSVSWDQYARDWNRPVHNFLLRHVYHSSISAFHLSKSSATFATFFLSALVHELLMFCLFKKVRGYLFSAQLMQMPLVMLSRTKFLKGKNVLGNVIFWIGLFMGPAVLTSLYIIA